VATTLDAVGGTLLPRTVEAGGMPAQFEFERDVQEATFHSPLADFESVTVETEVRVDPLTGRTARVVTDNFLLPDDPSVDEAVFDDEGCFFCPGTVEEATPTYPDWMGRDRGSVGEATSFPNLNPYGAHSNVVALTESHHVPIGEFTVDQVADGLCAAFQYVRDVFDRDPDAQFASVNMNYLRPAGSSLIHPHMQTLVDDRGTNEQRRVADAARRFYDDHGESYWTELALAERGGDRYLAEVGNVHWLAPFAPTHHRHLQGVAAQIHEGVPNPSGDVTHDFAEGLVDVLSYYDSVGLDSFNVALFVERDHPGLPPVLNVTARSVFDEYYWSDATFFTTLHDEGVVDVPPETYGDEAHDHF
jgi:galactose-1-phosphate uridylyltransferase